MQTRDFEKIQAEFVAGLDGDRAAYESALRALAPCVRAYLRLRLTSAHNDSDLEDIVQTILVTIHNKRATYERTLPLMPWVFGISKYKLMQHLRSSSRYRTVFSDQALDTVPETALQINAGDPTASKDLALMMSALSPEQRDAIRLTKIEGWSLQDAADHLGIGLSAMKLRVHRAMKRLHKLRKEL